MAGFRFGAWLLGTVALAPVGATAWAQADSSGAAEPPSVQASSGAPALQGAQSIAATPESATVGEIIVTAQRRSENLQSTPISITAFSASALAQRGIASVTDLQRQTPSLTFQTSFTSPASTLINIRGQGQGESNLGYQPAVALYVDGVYAGVTAGATTAGGLFDVQQVEVLKGPQGTLFGRNSTGGAVSLTTTLPSDTFSGVLKLGGGAYGEYDLNGVLNLPLVPTKADLRVVAQDIQSSGYGRDLTTHTDIYDQDINAFRATLLLQPIDHLQLILRADYTRSDSGGIAYHTVALQPGGLANLEAAAESGLPFTAAGLGAAYRAVLAAVPANRFDEYSSPGFTPHTDTESYDASLTAIYDLSHGLQLKSITGYRSLDLLTIGDSDATAYVFNESSPGISQTPTQFSQEFQFNGSSLSKRLNFATGLYYYFLHGSDDVDATFVSALNPANPNDFDNYITDVSYSAYGQATYALTDKLRATAGLRYTSERNENTSQNHTPLQCEIPTDNQIGGLCLGKFRNHFNNISYLASLDYQFTRLLFGYAKVSRGFKAGGENELGSGASSAFQPYNPEIATTGEAGLKSEFLDRRVRLNVDFYYTDYSDIQRLIVIAVPPASTASVVENAASGRIYGVESELDLAPIRNRTVTGTLAYTNAAYARYADATGDHTRDPFPDTPRWQASAFVSYQIPVPIGIVTVSADGSYQTGVYFQPDERTVYSGLAAVQPGYFLANARSTLAIASYGLELEVYAKNLLDKSYVVGGYDGTGSLGYGTSFFGPPRTYGVEATKRF